MGLEGYLAAKSDAEHCAREREIEQRQQNTLPDAEIQEVEQTFEAYGLKKEQSVLVAYVLRQRPDY